ncbi:MAG: Fe-S protein assembly co-chaperone HscB [Buchnera aphidicola (Eriosoma harunire)]
MNYFELFNLNQEFAINKNKLTKNFYFLQKKYHPDLFILDTINNQKKALKKSMIINQGYHILKNPQDRAKYLLQLNKINISHKNYCLTDKIFFVKYYTLCEDLHNLKLNHATRETLYTFKKNIVKYKIKKYYSILTKYFNQQEWINASLIVQKLEYFLKLKKQVNEIIDTTEIT